MKRFPTIGALADASPAEVLRQWQGLGYNRRAVNLHRAAKVIVEEHAGVVPDSVADLQTLPGVGPYTARAVAAIAFGKPEGAVDTNVRRVLGRAVAGDPARLDAAQLQAIAHEAVPLHRPGAWTHALMDIGASFCRPAAPRCDDCPARRWCRFAAAPAAPRARARPGQGTEAPFVMTTRWLRGRIVERLRATDGWARFDEPMGDHDEEAVGRALQGLAREGLIELDPTAAPGMRARLPIA
jgi:A/G-specific adenine glycosylase